MRAAGIDVVLAKVGRPSAVGADVASVSLTVFAAVGKTLPLASLLVSIGEAVWTTLARCAALGTSAGVAKGSGVFAGNAVAAAGPLDEPLPPSAGAGARSLNESRFPRKGLTPGSVAASRVLNPVVAGARIGAGAPSSMGADEAVSVVGAELAVPRWAWAIAMAPRTTTTVNTDIRMRMRFMGRIPQTTKATPPIVANHQRTAGVDSRPQAARSNSRVRRNAPTATDRSGNYQNQARRKRPIQLQGLANREKPGLDRQNRQNVKGRQTQPATTTPTIELPKTA